MADAHYSVEVAIEHLQRVLKMGGSRPWRLVIRKHNPGGMSGHGTTEVEAIHAGFDWEAGRAVITPASPLTELSPEQVEAIEKSVRAGGSWHAYEAQKKLRERALKAEARVAELEQLLSAAPAPSAPADQPSPALEALIEAAREALACMEKWAGVCNTDGYYGTMHRLRTALASSPASATEEPIAPGDAGVGGNKT